MDWQSVTRDTWQGKTGALPQKLGRKRASTAVGGSKLGGAQRAAALARFLGGRAQRPSCLVTIKTNAAGCRPSRQQAASRRAVVPPHSRLRAMGLSSGLSTGSHAGPSAVAFSGLMRALSSSACAGGGDRGAGEGEQGASRRNCSADSRQACKVSAPFVPCPAPGTHCRPCGPAPS